MTAREDDDLMVRYLEGAASDDEVARLEVRLHADPPARREFVRLAHVQALFVDLPRAQLATVPAVGRWWRPALVASAAALLAIGIAILWRHQTPPADGPTIASLEGAVDCERELAQIPVHSGDRLRSGDRLTVRSSAGLVLAWPDGTTARVDADSVIALGDRNDATIRLATGLVHAVVAHRSAPVVASPAGSPAVPFRITTPDAKVEDIGTEFSVRSTADGTTVRVDEGLVLLANAAGRVEVPAGSSASCLHGAPPRLDPPETAAVAPPEPSTTPAPSGAAPLAASGIVTRVDAKRKSFTLTDDATAIASEYRPYYAGGHPEDMLDRIAALHVGDHLTVTYVEREGRRVITLEPSAPPRK